MNFNKPFDRLIAFKFFSLSFQENQKVFLKLLKKFEKEPIVWVKTEICVLRNKDHLPKTLNFCRKNPKRPEDYGRWRDLDPPPVFWTAMTPGPCIIQDANSAD